MAEGPAGFIAANSSVVMWSEYHGDRERVWAQPLRGGDTVRLRVVERIVADRDADPMMSDGYFVVARDGYDIIEVDRLEDLGQK